MRGTIVAIPVVNIPSWGFFAGSRQKKARPEPGKELDICEMPAGFSFYRLAQKLALPVDAFRLLRSGCAQPHDICIKHRLSYLRPTRHLFYPGSLLQHQLL